MTDKYQALEDKIREANPETMELKEGCWAKLKVNDPDIGYFIAKAPEADYYYFYSGDPYGNTTIFRKQDIDEIIGQDLQLHHVLRAVRENSDNLKAMQGLSFDLRLMSILDKWDLTKSYKDQSNEVKDLLASILVGGEK